MLHHRSLGLLVGLAITCLFLVTGCEKEQESATPATEDFTSVVKEAVKDADTKAPEIKKLAEEKAPEIKKAVEEAQAVVTDLKTEATKTPSELKEQVKSMAVKDLKAMALKYKDAIMSQEGEVNTLMEKVKAIPVSEFLGKEAKQLKVDITKLTEAIKPLKVRYDIYIDKLKKLKADMAGLGLK